LDAHVSSLADGFSKEMDINSASLISSRLPFRRMSRYPYQNRAGIIRSDAKASKYLEKFNADRNARRCRQRGVVVR
jgi:hypothetical protein